MRLTALLSELLTALLSEQKGGPQHSICRGWSVAHVIADGANSVQG